MGKEGMKLNIPNWFELHFLGGIVPLQGEGTISGWSWYFRARHARWTLQVTDDSIDVLEVTETTDNSFFHEEVYGVEHDASWMLIEEALNFIKRELFNCLIHINKIKAKQNNKY